MVGKCCCCIFLEFFWNFRLHDRSVLMVAIFIFVGKLIARSRVVFSVLRVVSANR